MQDLKTQITEWGRKTFPLATYNSVVEHLRREVEEMQAETTYDGRLAEAADVQHLIYHIEALLLEEFDAGDLRAATWAKFRENQQRVWGDPDEYGVVEHVE